MSKNFCSLFFGEVDKSKNILIRMSFWLALLLTVSLIIFLLPSEKPTPQNEKLFSGNTHKTIEFGDQKREVRILAFGDLMPGRYVRTLMEKNGYDYIFEKMDWSNLPKYDILFANLEGPIKGEGYRHQTAMRFGFHRDTAKFLKEYGFNLLSIANNHILDQGFTGRQETITNLEEQNIRWCGDSTKADSESVARIEINGVNIAFVCFEDSVNRVNQKELLELVKILDEDKHIDLVVISAHWGIEYKENAHPERQVALAHSLIDNGADLIIGHHPHVVQNLESYKGKLIFYSLGNFVFDQYWSRNVQEGLGMEIVFTIDDEKIETQTRLLPLKSEKSQPRILTGEEKIHWLKKFARQGNYSQAFAEDLLDGEISSKDF